MFALELLRTSYLLGKGVDLASLFLQWNCYDIRNYAGMAILSGKAVIARSRRKLVDGCRFRTPIISALFGRQLHGSVWKVPLACIGPIHGFIPPFVPLQLEVR